MGIGCLLDAVDRACVLVAHWCGLLVACRLLLHVLRHKLLLLLAWVLIEAIDILGRFSRIRERITFHVIVGDVLLLAGTRLVQIVSLAADGLA